MRVLIIGAGIGGLCLAHGLRRAGIDVTVHERTTARTDWLQGYRIHINPAGAGALRACLPPEAWQAFLGSVSVDEAGFGFTTERLDDLLRFPAAEIERDGAHYGVSRIALLAGMNGVLRLGSEFTHYETGGDRVTAHFADGATDTADVLVGADGANSRVRRQLLPHAERRDTGIVAVAGRHALTGAAFPPALTVDANLVIPRDHGSLFTAVWRPRPGTSDEPPYILWGYSDAASRLPLGGADLRELVLDRISGWAPELRDLVAGSDPASVNAIRVRSAAPVRPWPTGRVTLLGDAIHNMTPMAGVGANTALRDASLLCGKLAGSPSNVVLSLREYEREMLEYGFAAVRQSLRNARQAGSSNRLGRAAFRTTLRTVGAVPPLRRRMAARMGR